MSDIVKVSWSGGKDSTCAMMLHIEAGHTVKAVCYIPMFTDNIPLLTKQHYTFILQTADLLRSLGAEVKVVTGQTYFDYVIKRSSRGKFKGRIFGFPCFVRGKCGFKRDSKLKALAGVDVGFYDYEDIGIAADETQRHNQLSARKRSILCKMGLAEQDAVDFCIDHNVLSPHYAYARRDGCTLCPNASERERQIWFRDYHEAKGLVVQLQNFVRRERPDITPLREHKWFLGD